MIRLVALGITPPGLTHDDAAGLVFLADEAEHLRNAGLARVMRAAMGRE